MAVTADSIVEMLLKVISLLEVDTADQGKINLAVAILQLVIKYIGTEKILETLGDGFEDVYGLAEEYVSGLTSDLTDEQRDAELAKTRERLDFLFDKMAQVQDAKKI